MNVKGFQEYTDPDTGHQNGFDDILSLNGPEQFGVAAQIGACRKEFFTDQGIVAGSHKEGNLGLLLECIRFCMSTKKVVLNKLC